MLKSLPTKIGSLANLKSLMVNSNKLRVLPLSIASLDNLRHLNLKDNLFKSIPSGVLRLPNLTGLNINLDCYDDETRAGHIGLTDKILALPIYTLSNTEICKDCGRAAVTRVPVGMWRYVILSSNLKVDNC